MFLRLLLLLYSDKVFSMEYDDLLAALENMNYFPSFFRALSDHGFDSTDFQ